MIIRTATIHLVLSVLFICLFGSPSLHAAGRQDDAPAPNGRQSESRSDADTAGANPPTVEDTERENSEHASDSSRPNGSAAEVEDFPGDPGLAHLRSRQFTSAVEADFNEIAGYADTIPAFVLRREAWDQLGTVQDLYQEMIWLEAALQRQDPEFFDRFLPFRVAVLETTPLITDLPLFLEDPVWFSVYRDALPMVQETVRTMVEVFPGRIFGRPAGQTQERLQTFDRRADDFLAGVDLSQPSFGSAQILGDYAGFLLGTMRSLAGAPTDSLRFEDYQRAVTTGRELSQNLVATLEDFSIISDLQIWDERIQLLNSQVWSWYAEGEKIRLEKLSEALWMKSAVAMAGRDPVAALELWYTPTPVDRLAETFQGEVRFSQTLLFEGHARFNDPLPARSTSYQWNGNRDQVISDGEAIRMGVNLDATKIAGGLRGALELEEADSDALCYVLLSVNGRTIVNKLNPDSRRFVGRIFFQVPEDLLQVGRNEFVFGILPAGEEAAQARLDFLSISWQ